jgi:hypothetical protein
VDALTSAELAKAQANPKHDAHTKVAIRKQFKIAMNTYVKLLRKLAEDVQTAVPDTRDKWDPVLEAAVMALAAYRTAVQSFKDGGSWTLNNWEFMYDRQHFNINMLALSKGHK